MTFYFRESLNWWRAWRTFPVLSWVTAARAFRNREFRTALHYYDKGLETRPNHPASNCARLDRVYCLIQLGELPLAVDSLSTLVTDKCDMVDAYRILARLLTMLGENRRSLEVLRTATSLFPGDSEIYSMFCHGVFRLNEDPSEIDAVKDSLELRAQAPNVSDSDKRYLRAALAHYHVCFSEGDEGEKSLASIVAHAKAPVQAMLIWAEILIEKGHYQQAREHLGRCMKQLPRDPRCTALLASLYLKPSKFFQPFWALRLAQLSCQHSCYRNTDSLALLSESYKAVGDSSGAELVGSRMSEVTSEREIDFDQLNEVQLNIERLRHL